MHCIFRGEVRYPQVGTIILTHIKGQLYYFGHPKKNRIFGDPDEYILDVESQYYVRYSHNTGQIEVRFGGQSVAASYTPNAGTGVCVVVRWDINNKLDGTNYLCVSVNDAHTFSATTQPSVSTPDGNLFIGSLGEGSNPANARIEGLTIYRRVLFDGTNGIDVGNGDEIALIYNSGTFRDPCEVTGSWDVVFCLPTNATVGELATGVGNAWSHPHSSNLINVTDGFMTTGTAWSGWTNIGTSTNEAVLATTEKIYNWGYKFDTVLGGDGEEYTLVVTAGNDWVIRALVHSADPVDVILYDKSNAAEIGKLTSTGTSTRANPFVALFTGEAPAGCISLGVRIQGTAALQTVYCHQVELLANLVTNPSLQGGAGDPYIPTGWTNNGLDAGDTEQELITVHSGADSLEFNVGANGEGIYSALWASALGTFTCYGGWFYGDASKAFEIRDINGRSVLQKSLSTGLVFTTGVAASWNHNALVARTINASGLRMEIRAVASAIGDRFLDDLYAFALTAVSLTATAATSANSTENSGLRVDGLDSLTQTVSGLNAGSGIFEFPLTQRHAAADVAKLGISVPVVFEQYQDANNYIKVDWSAANTLRLRFNAKGAGEQSGTVSMSGDWSADARKVCQVEYSTTQMILRLDDVDKITISQPAEFAAAPTAAAYFGSDRSGTNQADVIVGEAA